MSQEVQLFCVLDSKMEMYIAPYSALNRAVAIRIFETAVRQEGHDFNIHADDYSLWLVGEFDPGTAQVTALPLENMVNAHHIINKMRNEQEPERG